MIMQKTSYLSKYLITKLFNIKLYLLFLVFLIITNSNLI